MRDKLQRLGFVPSALGMRLRLGRVEFNTAESPFGLVIWFESFGPRSKTQYQVRVPYTCDEEAIAKLILKNLSQNFGDTLYEFETHFRNLGLPGS
jgi:hypothetical protein